MWIIWAYGLFCMTISIFQNNQRTAKSIPMDLMDPMAKRFSSSNKAKIPSFRFFYNTGPGHIGLTTSHSAPCGHSGTTLFGDLLTSCLQMLMKLYISLVFRFGVVDFALLPQSINILKNNCIVNIKNKNWL